MRFEVVSSLLVPGLLVLPISASWLASFPPAALAGSEDSGQYLPTVLPKSQGFHSSCSRLRI